MDSETNGFGSSIFDGEVSDGNGTRNSVDSIFDPFPDYDERSERESIATECDSANASQGDEKTTENDRGSRVPWEDGDGEGEASGTRETNGSRETSGEAEATPAPELTPTLETSPFPYPTSADPSLNPANFYERIFGQPAPTLASLSAIIAAPLPHAEYRDINNLPVSSSDPNHPFYFNGATETGSGYTAVGLARTIPQLAAFALNLDFTFGSVRDESHPLGWRLFGNFYDNPYTQRLANPESAKERACVEFKTLCDEISRMGEIDRGDSRTAPHTQSSGRTSGEGDKREREPDNASDELKVLKARGSAYCEQLNIEIIGLTSKGELRFMGGEPRHIRSIESAARANYSAWASQIGWPLIEHIEEEEFPEVRNILLVMAGAKLITEGNVLGDGIWRTETKASDGTTEPALVLVNGNAYDLYLPAQQTLLSLPIPRVGQYYLESSGRAWYDRDTLASNLALATDTNWRIAQVKELIELLERWKWKLTCHLMLIAGLILATFSQTIWKWRPQVSISGRSGGGKTSFFKFLNWIFGDLCTIYGDATEAGLRQKHTNNATVTLLDEFDQKRDEKKQRNRQAIMELIRNSGGGVESLRGSAGHKYQDFRLRHIFWLGGIATQVNDEADVNRFLQFELVKPARGEGGKLPYDELAIRALGQRLLACVVACAEQSREMAAKAATIQVANMDIRVGENYAAGMAMLAAVRGLGDDAMFAGISQIVEQMPSEALEQEDDSIHALNQILMKQVQFDGGRRASVADAIDVVRTRSNLNGLDSDEVERTLSAQGIGLSWFTTNEIARNDAIRESGGSQCLVIQLARVSEALHLPIRDRTLRDYLLRLPVSIGGRRRVGKMNLQCVSIGMRWLVENVLGDGDECGDEFDEASEVGKTIPS